VAAAPIKPLQANEERPAPNWRGFSSDEVEIPKKELAQRNIGKAFLSDAANIPSTLTMPTDAG
jgi:hypothetical protein